ncbi:MAG TPA: metalloregulator ArsR/SmtB family transcription factor [Pseudonocardiaceae bacterium]|jgi:ArsR family transcriptional regulator|nr:metalloregulator ArsR/SmtB family transcription factor [Pseudonocardiaceae bacterium]
MPKQLPLVDDSSGPARPDQELCCSPMLRAPLTERQSVELARIFKALGDPVRLRLLSLIASHAGGEACVCDLTDAFDLTGPTISHHLKVLREAGAIEGERRGTWVYYRVRPDTLAQLSAFLVLPGDIAPASEAASGAIGASA